MLGGVMEEIATSLFTRGTKVKELYIATRCEMNWDMTDILWWQGLLSYILSMMTNTLHYIHAFSKGFSPETLTFVNISSDQGQSPLEKLLAFSFALLNRGSCDSSMLASYLTLHYCCYFVICCEKGRLLWCGGSMPYTGLHCISN